MSLFGRRKLKKEEPPTLAGDIGKAADWLIKAMASSGYILDGTIESFRELDRFFDEQTCPGGLLEGKVGSKLFAIGCYMGQVFCQKLGGVWETDDSDPMGEINVAVHFSGGAVVWPVQRAMKRYENGNEDSLYAYGIAII